MSAFNCPKCGATLKVIPLAGAGAGWERGQEFAFGSGKMPAGAAEYSRETPTGRVDNLTGGLRLPAGQAAVTGVVALALGVIVGLWRGWPWTHGPTIGIVVGGLSWWFLLIDSRRLLRRREMVTADPSASEQAFSVEVTLPDEGRMLFVNFPGVKPEQVRRFARAAVESGRPSAESSGLSRSRFVAIRDESLRRGLVRWRGDSRTQGLETTTMGKHVFQHLVDGVLD